MPRQQRNIFVLSGKRGGFGAMRPMLQAIDDDDDLQLQLAVTDQHLNPAFGRTITEVEQQFTVAASVAMEQADDGGCSRAQALGRCMQGCAEVMDRLQPDICLLYGDRGETLATAFTASNLGIPIAHVQGGDISGSLDDNFRHAISKLAHLHFPSTEQSASRLRRLGEESWRIQVVGDNHLDPIVAKSYLSREEVLVRLGLDAQRPIMVLLQHSETTEPEAGYEQMCETLYAVRATEHQVVVIYPCSDQGYQGIIRAIQTHARGQQFRVYKNLEAPVFLGLMAIAQVMVGNSSAGLVEAPSFKLPVVNIGRRQAGRLHSNNVLHVAHCREAILEAINKVSQDEYFQRQVQHCNQPYGDGNAGQRIVSRLKDVSLDKTLLTKRTVQ